MERLGPNWLRTYVDAFKDKRRLVNVERCQRCPELDQQMLLALNGAVSGCKNRLPGAETIMKGLKKRLIEVSTSDGQSAVLGLFYTAIDPLKREPDDSIKRKPKIVVGVFPQYNPEVKYIISPLINADRLEMDGSVCLVQESLGKKDPFLVKNPKGFDFLFFKKSPFRQNHPYKIDWAKEGSDAREYPHYSELSLEENLINHALWYLNYWKDYRIEPELFKKTGFARFINSHCSDPRYVELHTAFIQTKHRK